MNKNFRTVSLFFANALVYGLNSLYYCFIQIYIGEYHPDNIAGILLSIGPFVSIFAPVFWGIFADKAKSKNLVLAISIIGSAVFYCLLGAGHSFWYLAAMLVLVMLFMSPFGGLIDIITLEYTAENNVSYGPIRICGTIAFGGLPMLLSGFTGDNIFVIFYAYAICAVAAAVFVMLSPEVEGHSTAEKRTGILPLFKDGRLMLIFIFVGISQFTWAYYLNSFPNHLTGDLGLPQTVWGINTFLTAAGEIPFFLMFTRLFDKMGMKKLLLVSLALVTLRYAALAFLTNVPIMLIVGFVTGSATTIFTYCGSVYINENIAPESKASANSLMYALGNGIPKVLAGVLGGQMTTIFGFTPSMIICTALCAAGLICFFITQRSKKLSY